VLPVATHAHLYHTVSGITLHRYKKLCDQFDTPQETRFVVDKMVAAVHAFDPLFFRKIDDPIPLDQTVEHRMFEETRKSLGPDGSAAFVQEFDADLGPLRSKLIDWKANAERVMAQSVRSMLGLPAPQLDDAAAIDLVLNPVEKPDPRRVARADDDVEDLAGDEPSALHVPEEDLPHGGLAGPAPPDGAGLASGARGALRPGAAGRRAPAGDGAQPGDRGICREADEAGLEGDSTSCASSARPGSRPSTCCRTGSRSGSRNRAT
jgi:hypothetical protein